MKSISLQMKASSQKGGDKSAQAESVTRQANGGSRIRLELPRIIERIQMKDDSDDLTYATGDSPTSRHSGTKALQSS